MKGDLKSSEGRENKQDRRIERREIDGWICGEFQGRKMKREDREEDSASIRIHQNLGLNQRRGKYLPSQDRSN